MNDISNFTDQIGCEATIEAKNTFGLKHFLGTINPSKVLEINPQAIIQYFQVRVGTAGEKKETTFLAGPI